MDVELVSYTKDPVMVIAKAASTCYRSNVDTPEKAEKLVEKCIKSGHHSVLEFADFHFHVKNISRVCSHQLVRHRLASYAQESQRYVGQDAFLFTIPKSIKSDEDTLCYFEGYMSYSEEFYRALVEDFGVPKEDARYVLPNACATNIDIKMNYRELMHFCGERLCNKAQDEIQSLARAMKSVVFDISSLLGVNLVPKCVRLGSCPEESGCGLRHEASRFGQNTISW